MQATYIGDATTNLKSAFPAIRGFMWFDANPKTSDFEWSFNAGGLSAFTTMGRTDYFKAPTY